jgi:cell division protein FtsB
MAKNGSAMVSLGLGAAILYLGAHAVTGPQGLAAYVDLQARERALELQLDELSQERAALEARAARLKPESLDRDFLDERARALLGEHAAEELVFALEADRQSDGL